MIVKTFMQTLFLLAADVGKARKRGDAEALKVAEKKLRKYEAVVLASDEVIMGDQLRVNRGAK